MEQYTDQRCGEYTDVYGFTASLLFALTGTLPKNAMLRRKDTRLLISSQILKTIPPHVITAIANGLQVAPEDRTATFERLRAELSAAPTVTASIETMEIKKRLPAAYQSIPEDKACRRFSGAWFLYYHIVRDFGCRSDSAQHRFYCEYHFFGFFGTV